MTSTTNYGLNIVEGTDVVNPLVQFNPNFTTIDGAMKANADASISAATCIKSGTNHAVTRANTDAAVFKFTATGDWNTGDTMTVDSTPVTVYTPNGTSPLTGAFVINTDVIASINGTRVVLYTANTQASSIDAIDVVYDNSISGLTAITAQGAIDELRSSQNIVYDNTVSGLTATDVQSAIDEIDSVVDGLVNPLDYSIAEKVVGTWINGKPLYQKTVDCGTMPNNTTKSVNHYISDIASIVDIYGVGIGVGSSIPIPYTVASGGGLQIYADTAQINFITVLNLSNTTGYVTLRYTKTTD